jgi:hypothetical protein
MDNLAGNLVPLFGIVFAVGLPLSIPIVFMALHYRRRRRQMELHHAERMAAIERGMEIPPLPVERVDRGQWPRRRSSLLPGLVWLFVGLAVVISLRRLAADEALLGLIPASIGLAYLIYYLVEGRKIEARLLDNQLRAGRDDIDGSLSS